MTAPAAASRGLCETCGAETDFAHEHKADLSGLDDGPYLPGRVPRKKRAVDPGTFSAERRRAWETRRAKYGPKGHG